MAETKEEAFVTPKAVGDPLDHLDLVVDTFGDAGGETVLCVGQECLDV
jgi:hypothetical protein